MDVLSMSTVRLPLQHPSLGSIAQGPINQVYAYYLSCQKLPADSKVKNG